MCLFTLSKTSAQYLQFLQDVDVDSKVSSNDNFEIKGEFSLVLIDKYTQLFVVELQPVI